MKYVLSILVISVFWTSSSRASADEQPSSSSSIYYFPEVKTIFPIFLGAGAGINVHQHFEFEALYGVTPKPYYETIGSVAASLGGNSSYKDVIESAFQNNSLWRVGLNYRFSENKKGWHAGFAYSRLTSTGRAGIDSVLAAATGLDYTQLKNALTAAGKSSTVDMSATLDIGELQCGYTWEIANNVIVNTALGAVKVLSTDINLQTGLPNFESSTVGKTLLANSESEVESIIDQYGISPTLSFSIAYIF